MREMFMDDMQHNDMMTGDMVEHHEHHKEHMDQQQDHKMSTMSDVVEQLEKDLCDEIEDCKKYYCMAKIADHSHCDGDAGYYLMEMARDEYTHATFIYEFMCEHNISIPEEHEVKYCELRDKMQGFFC